MEEQRVKALQLYYQNKNNATKTACFLSAKFNIRQVQSQNITSLIRKFERTGSIGDSSRLGKSISATSLEKSNEIRESSKIQ